MLVRKRYVRKNTHNSPTYLLCIRTGAVCVLHVLSTRRHPAQPVSVPILQSQGDASSVVTKPRQRYHSDTAVIVRYAVSSRQCNAMSSYWMRQATFCEIEKIRRNIDWHSRGGGESASVSKPRQQGSSTPSHLLMTDHVRIILSFTFRRCLPVSSRSLSTNLSHTYLQSVYLTYVYEAWTLGDR